MDEVTGNLRKVAIERPKPNPVQGERAATEAPGSFYGGSIGKSHSKGAPVQHLNKEGLPSTGREEAVLGCTAATQYKKDPSSVTPARHIFNELSLAGRSGVVTGAGGGLGLEMGLALVEAGAIIYCIDLPEQEPDSFKEARDYAKSFGGTMHYLTANVVSCQKSVTNFAAAHVTCVAMFRPTSQRCDPCTRRSWKSKED